MKKRTLLAFVTIFFIAGFLPIHAQEDFDSAFEEMEKSFEESVRGQEGSWDQMDAELESEWERQVKQADAEWEKLRAEVEQKWDEFYYSTNKEWVDYGRDKSTRSRVNFEAGEIEISTLVLLEEPKPAEEEPVTKPEEIIPKPEIGEPVVAEKLLSAIKPKEKKHIIAQAEKNIEQQTKKIFSSDNRIRQEILRDQVDYEGGKTVTPVNVDDYVKKYIAPTMKLEKRIIKSKDGKKRFQFTARIKMIPRHLKVRADKFSEYVRKYAGKYKLDPKLVFAVIHTESYFNPLAKSRIPAYGLMQLVPRFAALESYHYLNNEKKLLKADYLYNPENNVKLGATYLYLLHGKYFGKIKNPENRQSISIAAYNCGPTRMNKILVKKYDVNDMENAELVKLIRKLVPEETKDYIVKVQKRMTLYDGMI